MLTSEKEAREKWCPMVRIARREPVIPQPANDCDIDNVTVVAGCNTDALGRNRVPESCRCIASECAMWRWAPGVKMLPETGELVMEALGDLIPAKGYCGLAGRPEVAAA